MNKGYPVRCAECGDPLYEVDAMNGDLCDWCDPAFAIMDEDPVMIVYEELGYRRPYE